MLWSYVLAVSLRKSLSWSIDSHWFERCRYNTAESLRESETDIFEFWSAGFRPIIRV